MACAYIYLLHCLVTATMLWFHWNYGRNYTCWCFCLLPFTRSKLIYIYNYIYIYIIIYIYNYIYIYPNQSEAADLRIMVHGSNEPRSNAHWPNCIGSILRVAKRVMQFSDATYLSVHPFICVSTYPVIYVYYVISSFLSYIYIYIYICIILIHIICQT